MPLIRRAEPVTKCSLAGQRTVGRSVRVYFFCTDGRGPDQTPYCHGSVALAEGFRALGIEVFGNIPYWRLRPDATEHLIAHDPEVAPADCDIAIVDSNFGYFGEPLPHVLTRPARPFRSVFLDVLDGALTDTWGESLNSFDLILKTHANEKTRLPENARPWAFGLTDRIISAASGGGAVSEREPLVLCNFRIPHPVRAEAMTAIAASLPAPFRLETNVDEFDEPPTDPQSRLFWEQTGRRHYPRYFERLRSTAAVAAFGGFMIAPFPGDHTRPVRLPDRVANRIAARLGGRPQRRILQWDSWRLWESFASGCVTMHADLERYGASLPVMPKPGQHYMGIDLTRPGVSLEVLADPAWINRVGEAGREWAIEHYGPVATARRLLDELGLRGADVRVIEPVASCVTRPSPGHDFEPSPVTSPRPTRKAFR